MFKGLDKLCEAPEAIKSLAKTVSESGVSPKETVCKTCPLHDTCKWIAQFNDKGHGLKIIQTAHLASSIPTINNSKSWDADKEEGRAAVLGFVFDEEHQRALIKEISITQDDLNQKGELMQLVDSADDKSLISAVIGHLVAAIKTPGPLNRKHFNRFNVIDGTNAPGCDGSVMRVDRVCMLLRDTEFAVRKKASKAITSELENGNTQPDIQNTTKMLRLLSRLYSVFDNIRSCSPASDKVITSNVVHEANGVRRIDLCWMQRLPDVVSCAPPPHH